MNVLHFLMHIGAEHFIFPVKMIVIQKLRQKTQIPTQVSSLFFLQKFNNFTLCLLYCIQFPLYLMERKRHKKRSRVHDRRHRSSRNFLKMCRGYSTVGKIPA